MIHLSPQQAAALGISHETKPSKYRAVRTTVDGIGFDSKREADRYWQLTHDPEVAYVHRQVIFDLGPGVTYRCDFLVVWKNGRVTYEDAKGFRTREFITKKKLTEGKYPVEIREV